MQIACFGTWQPAPVTFCPPPLCVPFDFILARLFCVCVQALYQLHYPPSHASDRLIAGPLIHPSAVIHRLPSVNKWPLHNCSPPRQSAWSIPEVEPARSTNRPSAHFSGDCLTSFPEEDSEGVGRLQKVFTLCESLTASVLARSSSVLVWKTLSETKQQTGTNPSIRQARLLDTSNSHTGT